MQRQGSSASHGSSVDNSKLVSPAPLIGSRGAILLPRKDNLLTLPHSQGQLRPSRMDVIRRSLADGGQSQSSVRLGPLGLINSTTQPGRNGVAGASKGKLIYFRHLSMK